MKRFTVVFPIVVLALFVYAFTAARFGRPARAIPTFTPTRPPQFVELSAPRGEAVLRGRVVDLDGRGVAGVSLYFRSGNVPFWGVTDAEGRFAFEGLADQDVQVALLHEGHSPRLERTAPGEVEFTLPPPTPDPPPMPELAAADLHGRVVHPLGRTALDEEGYELVFTPREQEHEISAALERRVRCDHMGYFSVPALQLSTYEVRVLPSWAAGSSWPDLASSDYARIEHSSERVDERIVLSSGVVSGRVFDDEDTPVPGALVILAAPDDLAHVWIPQTTDVQGRYRFVDVPPGQFTLSARAGEAILLDVPVETATGRTVALDLGPLVVRSR